MARRKILNLSQLPSILSEDKECVITIGGEEYIITLRRLSYKQWREIDEETPLAEPFVNYNNVTGKRDFEMSHPLTQQRIVDRNNEVTLKRLAAGIVQKFPKSCKTLEERAAYLAEIFDSTTLSALFDELDMLHEETTRSIRTSPVFQSNGSNGAMGDEEVGEDSE